MNFENIIVCVICLVVIAIVSYFMYTKVTSQNQEMVKLSKRFETIEMLLARPPPPDDLHAMYKPKYTSGEIKQNKQNKETPSPMSQETPSPMSPPCESAMCDLEPLHIETNEDELDYIVNAELNKVIEKDNKASPKRKVSKTTNT